VIEETILRRMPLFSSLTAADRLSLAESLQERRLREGSFLFYEGKTSRCLYILLEGEVEVIKAYGQPGERILGRRTTGTVFGEMSLFSAQGAHTASLRACTPLRLLKIRRRQFVALLHDYPGMSLDLMRLLARRLEESENATIQDLLVKNRELAEAYRDLQLAQAQIIEKEKLEHELELARQIQQRILPHEVPQIAGLEFGALMVPARLVAGDFYDFIPLGKSHLGIMVGDVSDKGLAAAMFMSLTYSLLKLEALRKPTPALVLEAVNQHLMAMDVSEMFVTVLYGILDINSREFSYARAAHPPPIFVDIQGQGRMLPYGVGQPLGVLEDIQLDQNRVKLEDGCSLLLFSDGLTEASNPPGDVFGETGALEVLKNERNSNAQQTCQRLYEAVSSFESPLSAQDDITLVYLRDLCST
jgi:serine phosphatase RsbU (regulator of sigma subunit)